MAEYRYEVETELLTLRMVGLSDPGDIAQVVALIELGVRLGLEAAAHESCEACRKGIPIVIVDDDPTWRVHEWPNGNRGSCKGEGLRHITPGDVLRKP